MIFFMPFFFLLDDSSLESTGVALVAVDLSAVLDEVVAGCAASGLVADPAGAATGAAAAAAPASGTGAGDPGAFGLATAALPVAGTLASGAGVTVVPGVLTGGE